MKLYFKNINTKEKIPIAIINIVDGARPILFKSKDYSNIDELFYYINSLDNTRVVDSTETISVSLKFFYDFINIENNKNSIISKPLYKEDLYVANNDLKEVLYSFGYIVYHEDQSNFIWV